MCHHRLREFLFVTKRKEKYLNSWHVEKLYYYDKFRCPKCRQSKSVRNRAFTSTTTFRGLLSFQRKRLSTYNKPARNELANKRCTHVRVLFYSENGNVRD